MDMLVAVIENAPTTIACNGDVELASVVTVDKRII